MFPPDLTFGVFDAAAEDRVVSAPVLWLWQVQSKNGKVFCSLMDGGSVLAPDTSTRFLLRSTTNGAECVVGGMVPKPGDVVQLLEYAVRKVIGKQETVFVISRMVILRSEQQLVANLPRGVISPYPSSTAVSDLEAIRQRPQCTDNDRIRQHATCRSSDVSTSAGADVRTNAMNNNQHPSTSFIQGPSGGSRPYAASSTAAILSKVDSGGQHHQQLLHDVRRTPYSATEAQASSGGPVAWRRGTAEGGGSYVEIRNLTSFLGRWTVRGRFINRGEIRTYSNQRGEGKIWSCDLMDSDEDSGTIRCTFFNRAVDKYFPLIQDNQIYSVSRGSVKPANRKFNTGTHQFELQLSEDTEIQWLAADDPTIPAKKVAPLTPIKALANLPKATLVSVVGVVLHIGSLTEIVTRASGQPRPKRDMTLVDLSRGSIDVTFWGSKTGLLESVEKRQSKDPFAVVTLENVRVDEFNGRKLSSTGTTDLIVFGSNNAQGGAELHEQMARLQHWFEESGRNETGQFFALSTANWSDGSGGAGGNAAQRMTISELRQRALQVQERELEDKGFWGTCRATLTSIDRDRSFYWVACPNCGKKVQQQGSSTGATFGGKPLMQGDEFGFGAGDIDDGDKNRPGGLGAADNAVTAFCANCNKDVAKPLKKYMLNVEVADDTGSLRCSALGDKGSLIIGCVDANTLSDLHERPVPSAVYQSAADVFVQRLQKEFIFRIQVKSETYRDEARLKYRIFGVEPLNAVIQKTHLGQPFHNSPGSNNNINSYEICRANLIKDSLLTIDNIYSCISRVAQ